MDPIEAHEGTASEPLPDGVASPPPPILSLVVWIGAFSAVTWGMMVLFRDRSRPPPGPPGPPADPGEPAG